MAGGRAVTDGYRVDTNELEAVVTRLRNLQKNLGETAGKAKYNTVLQISDVGWDFSEANELHTAHANMKASLEDLIKNLESLIDDFSGKTQTVTNSYKESEYQIQAAMGGDSQTAGSGSRLN
jgi:hypothetical protein